MPSYCGVTTRLISQFDIKAFPEFPPVRLINNGTQLSQRLSDPPSVLVNGNIISVYTVSYPASQFWLTYSIEPRASLALCYFKLYINKDCVVSWGCGEREGYQGKTQFGLFDSGESWMGTNGIEKRVLSFARDKEKDPKLSAAENRELADTELSDDVVEIRVFRSRGRIRADVVAEDMTDNLLKRGSLENAHEGDIRLVPGGNIEHGHPQRYYKYALIDPLDEPFAIFRYYFRTWSQLHKLGIIKEAPEIQDVPEERPSNEDIRDSPPPSSIHEVDSDKHSEDDSSTASSSSQASVLPTNPTKKRPPTPIPSNLPNPPAPSPIPALPGSYPLPSPVSILAPPSRPRSFSPFDWLRRATSPDHRASSRLSIRDPSPALHKGEKSNLSTMATGDVDEPIGLEKKKKGRPRISILKGVVASARRRKGDT